MVLRIRRIDCSTRRRPAGDRRAPARAESRGERGQPRGAGADDRGVRRAARRRGRSSSGSAPTSPRAGSTPCSTTRRRLDGVTLEPGQLRVSPRRAARRPSTRPIRPISKRSPGSARNILAYQEAILHRDVIAASAGPASSWACCIGRCAGWASASRAGRRPIRRAC